MYMYFDHFLTTKNIRTDPKPVNNLFIFFQALKRKKRKKKNSRKRYCDRGQR